MSDTRATGTRMHPAIEMYASEVAAGQMSRREFLGRATALGATAAAAYAAIGLDSAGLCAKRKRHAVDGRHAAHPDELPRIEGPAHL
jgi:hypothetical protein